MSEIARNYIAANEARKQAEVDFDETLKRQFGPSASVWNSAHKEWNAETLAAFEIMESSIDTWFKARSIANAAGGDFALPSGEVYP